MNHPAATPPGPFADPNAAGAADRSTADHGVVRHHENGVVRHQNAHFSRLTSRAFDRTYYGEHRAEGLDYAACGPWQHGYAHWLRDVFQLHDRRVLDIGCACGAQAHGFTLARCHAIGIDASEFMIRLGRRCVALSEGQRPEADPTPAHYLARPWPQPPAGFHTRLEICDAANLHLLADAALDFVNAHQTAEHWPPDLVPRILRELARVTRPGGILFCVLDTCELGHRTGRNLAAEDPTHVCIRPLSWWHERCTLAGWRIRTETDRPALVEHERCYFARHDWDWFTAERV